MPLVFGASTFSFMWNESALQSMRRLRQAGYRSMDVIAVPGHLWPSELNATQRQELQSSLEQDDIVIDSMNTPALDLNIASCIADVRDFSVNTYIDLIRLGVELNARGIVVVPGRVSALLPPNADDTLNWTAQSVATLSECAAEFGQTILLESHPLTGFATAKAMCDLVDHIARANVKIAYDVANAEFIGEDQVEAIDLMSDRLGQTHLSDGTRSAWRHDPPGTGTVPFKPILEALEKSGFAQTNIVEIISGAAADNYIEAAKSLNIEIR